MMNFKLDFGCSCRQAFCFYGVCVLCNVSEPDLLDIDPRYNFKSLSGKFINIVSDHRILELFTHLFKTIQKQGNIFFIADPNPCLCE